MKLTPKKTLKEIETEIDNFTFKETLSTRIETDFGEIMDEEELKNLQHVLLMPPKFIRKLFCPTKSIGKNLKSSRTYHLRKIDHKPHINLVFYNYVKDQILEKTKGLSRKIYEKTLKAVSSRTIEIAHKCFLINQDKLK